MCEQTEINYLDGDVVWVKLGSCWWPGEVVGPDKLPPDVLPSFKKPPIAVVKFFQEDAYEYVKNLNCIYKYNCSLKNEFINKGLYMYRTKHGHMEKFPEDVIRAEAAVGGDITILTRDEFQETKKESYADLFGDPAKKTPNPSSKKGRLKGRSSDVIKTHTPRKVNVEKPNYKVHILVQGTQTTPSQNTPSQTIPLQTTPSLTTPSQITNETASTPSTSRAGSETAEDNKPNTEQQPVSTPPSTPKMSSSGLYSCHACSFSTTRLNVLILHNKTHSVTFMPYTPSPVRKKLTKPSKSSPNITKTPKPRKPRPEKTDKTPKKSASQKRVAEDTPNTEVKKTKTDEEIKSSLLADWDIDDDSNDESTMVVMAESRHTEVAVPVDSPAVAASAELPEAQVPVEIPIPISKNSDDIPQAEKPESSSDSKYEFCEDEDWPEEADVGRKIPRVKNPKRKEDTKSISLDDDEVAREVAELLNKTTVPELPSAPEPLKVEENFPEPSIVKSPDKNPETITEAGNSPEKKSSENQPTKTIFKTKTFFRSRHSRSQDAIGKYVAEQLNAERIDMSEDINGSEILPTEVTRVSSPIEPIKVARLAPKIQLKKMKAEAAQMREKEKNTPDMFIDEFFTTNSPIATTLSLTPGTEVQVTKDNEPMETDHTQENDDVKSDQVREELCNNSTQIEVEHLSKTDDSVQFEDRFSEVEFDIETEKDLQETENPDLEAIHCPNNNSETLCHIKEEKLNVEPKNETSQELKHNPEQIKEEDKNVIEIESQEYSHESDVSERIINYDQDASVARNDEEVLYAGNLDEVRTEIVCESKSLIQSEVDQGTSVAKKHEEVLYTGNLDVVRNEKECESKSFIQSETAADVVNDKIMTEVIQQGHSEHKKTEPYMNESTASAVDALLSVSRETDRETRVISNDLPEDLFEDDNKDPNPPQDLNGLIESDEKENSITTNTGCEIDLKSDTVTEEVITDSVEVFEPNKNEKYPNENLIIKSDIDATSECQNISNEAVIPRRASENIPSESDLQIAEALINLPSTTIQNKTTVEHPEKMCLENEPIDEKLFSKNVIIGNNDIQTDEICMEDSIEIPSNHITSTDNLSRFETELEKSENLNAAQSLVQMSELIEPKLSIGEMNTTNNNDKTKPYTYVKDNEITLEHTPLLSVDKINEASSNGKTVPFETTSPKLLKILEEPSSKPTNIITKQIIIPGKEKILNIDVGKSGVSKSHSPKQKIIIRRSNTPHKNLLNSVNEVSSPDKIILSRSNNIPQDGSSVQTFTIQTSAETAPADPNTIVIQQKVRKFPKPPAKLQKIKSHTSIVSSMQVAKGVNDPQSTDDALFDINSMPIVLSEDILTPESIEKMPIVMSDGNILTNASSPQKIIKPKPTKIESEKIAISATPANPPKQEIKTLIVNPVNEAKVTTPNILSKSSKLRGTKMLVIDKTSGKQKYIMTKQVPHVDAPVKEIKPQTTLIKPISPNIGKTQPTLIQAKSQNSGKQKTTLIQPIVQSIGKTQTIIQTNTQNVGKLQQTLIQSIPQITGKAQQTLLHSVSQKTQQTIIQSIPQNSGKTQPTIIQSIPQNTGKTQQTIIQSIPQNVGKTQQTLIQSIPQNTGKSEKFILLPSTASPRQGRTQKIVIDPQTGKAHMLVAKGADSPLHVNDNKPVAAKIVSSAADCTAPGNTVMIITNAQGATSRIVLKPEHEKILFPNKQQPNMSQLKTITHRISTASGTPKSVVTSIASVKPPTKIVPKQQKSAIITSKGQLIVGGRVATTSQNIASMPEIRPVTKRVISGEPKKLIQTKQKNSSEPLIFFQQKSGAMMQLTAAQFEHLQRTGQIIQKTVSNPARESKVVIQKTINISPSENIVSTVPKPRVRKQVTESPTPVKKLKQDIAITPSPAPVPALCPISNTVASTISPPISSTSFSHLENFEELLPSTAIARPEPTAPAQPEPAAPPALSDGQLLAVPGEHFGGPPGSFYLCVEDNCTFTPIDNRPLMLENNQLVPMPEQAPVLVQPERRDILEAALANSDVFHGETRDEAPDFRDLNANVSVHCRVSETSTTLNQPIMTPVEVPTKGDSEPAIPSNLEDGLAVIGVTPHTVPTSLELPITVTDPRIAPKTTDPLSSHNYGSALLPSPNTEMSFVSTEEVEVPIGGPISMPLLTEEESVGKSMPILTDDVSERVVSSVESALGCSSPADARESETDDGQWPRRLLTPSSDVSERSLEIPLQPQIQIAVSDIK